MEFEPLLQKNAAILVIGIQNDYCDRNGALIKHWDLDVAPITEMLSELPAFLDEARNCHIPIFWVQLSEDSAHMQKNFKLKMESLGKGALDLAVPGWWGHDWCGVKPVEGEHIFDCNNYDALSNEKLRSSLKKGGIETLVVSGAYTSRAIDTTVRSAATKGYNVFVPIELVAMPKQMEEEHYAALTVMNMLFAYVMTKGFILSVWNGKKLKKPSLPSAILKRIKGIR